MAHDREDLARSDLDGNIPSAFDDLPLDAKGNSRLLLNVLNGLRSVDGVGAVVGTFPLAHAPPASGGHLGGGDDEGRDAHEDDAEDQIRLVRRLARQIDLDRKRARDSLERSGESQRGAELPEAPRQRERRAARHTRNDHGKGDASKHARGPGAQARGRLLQATRARPERRFDSDDQKWKGDKHLGQDDRRRREGDGHAESLQLRAEHASSAESGDQGDACDNRRKGERERDEHSQNADAPPVSRKSHGQGNAQDQVDRQGCGARLQAQREGVRRLVA